MATGGATPGAFPALPPGEAPGITRPNADNTWQAGAPRVIFEGSKKNLDCVPTVKA